MRLLFEKGKQRELLMKEKNFRSLTWNSFSESLEVKFPRLKSFFYEETLMDEKTFNKLKLKKDYEKFIIKRLDENWGQSKGGNNSLGSLMDINVPEKSEELAEFWGIMLGDGNVQKVQSYKVGVYKITIFGNSDSDRDYLINFVKPLGEKLFKVKAGILKQKSFKELSIIFYRKKIVDFFEQNEFPSGNKIINEVRIPNWIKNNDLYLAACLRGLYDTDGCFYKLTNQNSYQIHFCNNNFKLLTDVRNGLLTLGINVSKIIRNKSIVITKKSEIEKFYKTIGFHNSKHLDKIKMTFSPVR